MAPCGSLSLMPESPQRWGDRGDSRSHPCVGSDKIPPTRLLCASRDRDTPLGTSMGTRDSQNVPSPVCRGSPTPTCSPRHARGGGRGLCLHPGLCPPALALRQLLEIFPIENPTGRKIFPQEKRGLIPQDNARHQNCTFQAGSGGTSRGHRGHFSRPHRTMGVPKQGDSGVASSRSGGSSPPEMSRGGVDGSRL